MELAEGEDLKKVSYVDFVLLTLGPLAHFSSL
jgi:hypothetical protein